MNMRRALPLRSFAVFNSNTLASSVSSMLIPPQQLFFAQYTIMGRFSLRESLRCWKRRGKNSKLASFGSLIEEIYCQMCSCATQVLLICLHNDVLCRGVGSST